MAASLIFGSELFGMALASGVWAGAIKVGSLFHRLALRAAILARSHGTRADGVCAFLAFRSRHEQSPLPLGSELARRRVECSEAPRHKPYPIPINWCFALPWKIYIK